MILRCPCKAKEQLHPEHALLQNHCQKINPETSFLLLTAETVLPLDIAEALRKWSVKKLTGQCGDNSFSALR